MITPELETLLEPLERFESIRRRAARLGNRLADLSYANPYEGARQAARAALREALEEERLLDLQYSPFGGQTLARRAAADALRESHGLSFAFDDVVLTPGAMSALHVALRAAGRPGDEVLIPVPCWLDYPLYARSMGLVPRFVPLRPRASTSTRTRSPRRSVRAHARSSQQPLQPNRTELHARGTRRLGRGPAAGRGEHGSPSTLIADETHRDFVEPGRYHSAAAFFDRTVLVYSFGKYHFMQGQRLGYAASSPVTPSEPRQSGDGALDPDRPASPRPPR